MKAKRIALVVVSMSNGISFYLVLNMPLNGDLLGVLGLLVGVTSISLIILSYNYAAVNFRSPTLWGLLTFIFPYIVPIILASLKVRTSYTPETNGALSESQNYEVDLPQEVFKNDGHIKQYWAYIHKSGTIQVKEWYQLNTYVEEAERSQNVSRFLEFPFKASSFEEAELIATKLLRYPIQISWYLVRLIE